MTITILTDSLCNPDTLISIFSRSLRIICLVIRVSPLLIAVPSSQLTNFLYSSIYTVGYILTDNHLTTYSIPIQYLYDLSNVCCWAI